MSRLPLLCLVLLTSAAAGAAPTHALSDIEATVSAFVRADIGHDSDTTFAVGSLDPRLRLPVCTQPLQAQYTHARPNQASRSVQVRCEGAKPWSLYVPVVLRQQTDVIVVRRAVQRGDSVQRADIARERRPTMVGQGSYLADLERVLGQVARRNLAPGDLLTTQHVERADLVKRGDHVIVTSGSGAISVSVKGQALANGATGDRIPVRNLRSKRVIQGVVNARGEIEVRTGTLM